MNETESNIAIAEDETVIRDYQITEVDYRTFFTKRRKSVPKHKKSKHNTSGRLLVTNRRIVYNIDNRHLPLIIGSKCKDLYSQQIRIEDIQGVDFMTSTARPSLMGPVLFLILSLLSIFLLGPIVGIVLLLASIIWIVLRIKKTETSMIFGIRSGSSDYGMFISEMSRGYAGNIQYWCAPTPEFEVMARELGAIILDLQKYGDDCLEKWVQPGYSPNANMGAGINVY